MPSTAINLVRLSFVALALLVTAGLFAHPEDDFCEPGDDSMDPALCAALAELNNSEGKVVQSDMPSVLDESGNERSVASTAVLYVSIGVRHILPDGLDHILFVLAIFLASIRLRALVIQISAFTVAHTATLALAATGVITPSPAIVEPLIALTIGFVAVENLFFKEMTQWRPAVVFGFGLVHGMGFAGFFGELGLPPGQFWSALISFNVGVEIGQMLVIAAAAAMGLALRRVLNDPTGARQYRRFVVLPGSALIGLVGFWWAVERIIP
jgi:hypothetical protein